MPCNPMRLGVCPICHLVSAYATDVEKPSCHRCGRLLDKLLFNDGHVLAEKVHATAASLPRTPKTDKTP